MEIKNQKRRNIKYKSSKRITLLILLLLIFTLAVYMKNTTTLFSTLIKPGSKTIVSEVELNGKILSVKYCGGCHMVPDPTLLDKENWQIALAMMAPRLGIFYHKEQAYPIYTDIDESFYPSKPAMSSTEWQSILDYYTIAAPKVLKPSLKKSIRNDLPFFTIMDTPEMFYRRGNTASFVKIDTLTKPHRVFVNRSGSNTLFVLNENLRLKDSLVSNGPIVNMDISQNELLSCKIGSNLFGNNSRDGSITKISISAKGIMKADTQPLFDHLARPVQIQSVDLNGDDDIDFLVCEFGNISGALLWMENLGNGTFIRNNIRAVAGATRAIVHDYNNDGKPDIWAQFSQGEEGIFLFTNMGYGLFSEKQVIRLPPSYGSSYFELNDFNKDGYPDILYTTGDRGDGIPQLKPYHGVYIFLNDGKNQFAEKYFFPINGCIKAMARDFDNDGDLDIAAIGFFTDNRNPEEGFTFLRNNGNLDFQPYSLPLDFKFYKASTMDVADIDSDGKLDIILGHGFIGTKTTDDIKPLFIVLKNRF